MQWPIIFETMPNAPRDSDEIRERAVDMHLLRTRHMRHGVGDTRYAYILDSTVSLLSLSVRFALC